MSVPFEQRLTCSVKEACAFTGIGRSKVLFMCEDGRLKSRVVDGKRYIQVASILAVLGIAPPVYQDAASEAAS